MPSIIGATYLIPSLRAKAKKRPSRATGAYRERNEQLPHLGNSTYAEYLKSPEWAEIRSRVLKRFPICCRCDRTASQVHHFSYHPAVILGRCDSHLLPVCEPCHVAIEFVGNRKLSLSESQIQVMRTAKMEFVHRIRSVKGLLKKYDRKLRHAEFVREQSKKPKWSKPRKKRRGRFKPKNSKPEAVAKTEKAEG